MRVTKEFKWHCAHRLSTHEGECSNIHGHTYKLQVTVEGKLNYNGMVIDFQMLKESIEASVIKNLDHSILFGLNRDKIDNELLQFCKDNKLKHFIISADYTTAECMAEWIKNELTLHCVDVKIVSVKVWETDTAFAEAL